MLMLRLVRTEFIKLREPVTLLTLAGAPLLAGTLVLIGVAAARRTVGWPDLLPGLGQFWLIFLFPLSAIAFTAFAAQIEHRARAWDHLLTLPAPKWQVLAAKALVVSAASLSTFPLFLACVALGGMAGGLVSRGGPLLGPVDWTLVWAGLSLGAAASVLMVALQLWLALRFVQFIAPVMLGIGGWGVAIAGLLFSQAEDTRFVPWGLAYRAGMAAAEGPPHPAPFLALGLGGGVLAFAAMCLHLSRREMR